MSKLSQIQSAEGQISTASDRFKAYTVYVDTKRMNTDFIKYGHITAPLAIQNNQGGYTVDSEYNLWVQHNKTKGLLATKFPFLPNEAVDETLKAALEEHLADSGLKITKEIEVHDGKTKYWTLLTDELYTIEEVNGKKDQIKVGVSVRNGVGTNVGLGVDLYTMRQWCSNGALARGKNLGSFAIYHRKGTKASDMIKSFATQLYDGFKNVADLINVYKLSTKLMVTTEVANKMFKKLVYMPNYLPDNWVVADRKEIVEILKAKEFQHTSKPLVEVTEEKSLWNTFNAITQKHRDAMAANKIQFPLVARHQTKLHQAMIQVVRGQ